jgi:SAM-dependent methyltransferase
VILSRLDRSAQSVLDVGCGGGFLLNQVRQHLPHVSLVGLDVTNLPGNQDFVKFVNGLAAAIPFQDKSFDIVVCTHTLEHLFSPGRCIAELIRVARQQIIIVTPRQRYYYYTLDEHVNFFPHRAALVLATPLLEYWCENVDGDWLYRHTVLISSRRTPPRRRVFPGHTVLPTLTLKCLKRSADRRLSHGLRRSGGGEGQMLHQSRQPLYHLELEV